MTTTVTRTPFEFFDLRVARTRRVGASMLRVTFAGDGLAGFASGGRDQRFKLFLPHPYQDFPVVPTGEDWFAQWRAMDPLVRAVMRSYTVREQRRDPDEFDVDFALHGDGGPASRWAARARPGDPVTVLAPVVADNAGVDFRPPPGTDWVLLAGDETALPALAGILGWLPPGTRARVWIEVPDAADLRPLPTVADEQVTWLIRDRARPMALCDAVRAATLPAGTPYAWIAGEAATVRALRRHLVADRGLDRSRITFTGYWRRGATEEDLIAEAISGAAPTDD
ncbi:NADPH-dependent ferric siderophore reductase, contains FAD-binding and SIP domains [Micromonospora pattaloongensis]|uniref:NADPH-dependent ferric siderophore reductase, contains FAD-binding and SIP domains n=1 Tax=Micromonospora pattaloongensis TaxID=405436 RepID=A0A1H3RVS8_9ACTN|nr:siderophore-interacting protein [Micromonospora pattaloongensis]SDZ29762.1 NADPH-dependent ferric siderophore reductase, contains FAD-binding and SIP domains [Micromonospora pattaloongensis]